MESEKRISRSYKATESSYKDAMKRAAKENKKLAQLVETFVSIYATGATSFKFFTDKVSKSKTKKQ